MAKEKKVEKMSLEFENVDEDYIDNQEEAVPGKDMSITDLPGIGPASAEKLLSAGYDS